MVEYKNTRINTKYWVLILVFCSDVEGIKYLFNQKCLRCYFTTSFKTNFLGVNETQTCFMYNISVSCGVGLRPLGCLHCNSHDRWHDFTFLAKQLSSATFPQTEQQLDRCSCEAQTHPASSTYADISTETSPNYHGRARLFSWRYWTCGLHLCSDQWMTHLSHSPTKPRFKCLSHTGSSLNWLEI